jgi:hypothetical protein
MLKSENFGLAFKAGLGFDSFLNLNLNLSVSTLLSFQPFSESALRDSVSPSLYKVRGV